MTAVAFTLALAALACVDPLGTKPVSTPEWDAKNVSGYAETVAGLPPEVVLGWDLVVVGDVARWKECTSSEVCGNVERSIRVSDLVGVERAGRTVDQGHDGDVFKLSLAARPRYVVPDVGAC